MAEIKNYDSEFCGSIPIHHINRIQDHGYLVVLDLQNFTMIQVSENCSELLNLELKDCIGKPFANFCSKPDFEKLQHIAAKKPKDKVHLTLFINKNGVQLSVLCLLHFVDDLVIIEIEQHTKGTDRTFFDVFQEVKQFTSLLDHAHNLAEVAEVTVHELRRISGFDGVLMYQFDENWNGTVIAEEKDHRLEAYLGQTFPASDIPKQARQLYLKNPYRLIPNRDYIPVALYPILNPVKNSFIDLSHCNLRGVPGVHLEYMKNMGIMASMSIRIIKDEQLWGLISCHHMTKLYLDQEICSIFEWLSTVISNRISILIDQKKSVHIAQMHFDRSALIDQIYAKNDIIGGLFREDDTNVLDMFDAGGAIIYLNGNIETIGQVPKSNSIEDIHLWLQGKNITRIHSTSYFTADFDDASVFSNIGSGVLVIPIDNDKGDYLVCLRPEVVETINWGGDPDQAIKFDADGKNYHPRNSFKLWKQEIRNHSKPWKNEELELAETLRSFLFEFRTKQLYI
ncbi:GAF domain-containing protein [Pedobacter sp. MC2016-24]|uniref:GAF domain-containing protein n=1 Tax=Pedobacter sp. MC2016-24 TaxID=2780090 RepID=UPI0018814CFA|nr:GAF domain-containing protein [Pedobacter sp. MC2016-24]MBE9599389.1 GAF domain-containing protein [Pedobacter sp. MC2016-24]